MNVEEQLFRIEGQGWYIRTPVSPEGPFATEDEALNYLALLEKVSAARVAGIWFVDRDKPN